MAYTGLRRVGYWRNRQWGHWNQRHLWLYESATGRWWVFVRVGTGERSRDLWKCEYPSEAEARAVIEAMMARATERYEDEWSYFGPDESRR